MRYSGNEKKNKGRGILVLQSTVTNLKLMYIQWIAIVIAIVIVVVYY